MAFRILAVSGALLTVLALPAAASAEVKLDPPLRPCYATTLVLIQGQQVPQSERVELTLSGFTPNSLVDFAIDGQAVPDAQGVATDANGAIGALTPYALSAPFIASGQREFTITATEQGNPANTLTATARTTALGVSVKPQQATPSSKVRWSGSGFTLNRGVFAHYIYKNKLRKTVRMTRDPGRCGTFSKRARQIPVASPGLGKWTVQFDQFRKFDRSPDKGAFVRLTINVFRKFG